MAFPVNHLEAEASKWIEGFESDIPYFVFRVKSLGLRFSEVTAPLPSLSIILKQKRATNSLAASGCEEACVYLRILSILGDT